VVGQVDHLGRAIGDPRALRGTLDVDLRISGRVAPPSLDVDGAVTGARIGHGTTSARQLVVTIDAADLPARPHGKAHLELRGIVDAGRPLGALTVDAHAREDHSIAVRTRSVPPIHASFRPECPASSRSPARSTRAGSERLTLLGQFWR
jgi:hypothetical protein